MISRLLSFNIGRQVVRAQTLRFLRTTAVAASSSHDEEPIPVHVPKPAVGERNWLGSLKAPPEQFPHEPYAPGKSDVFSFLGAGLGVILTVLAVTFYNDIFGKSPATKHTAKDTGHKGSSKDAKHADETEEAEPAESDASSSHEAEARPAEGTQERHSETSQEHAEASEEHTSEPAQHSSTSTKEAHEDSSSHEHKHSDKHAEPPVSKKSESDHDSATAAHEEKKAADHPSGEEVPESVEYLLVGAGTAAYYASLAIRARHADAKVLMIGEEDYLPYNRPPLSKELWWYGDEKVASTLQYTGINGKKRDVFFEAEGFFVPPGELPSTAHGGVSLLKNRRVERINPDEKKAYLDDKTCIKYGKCLIATGGRPRTLPVLEKSKEVKEKVLYLRGVDDYRKLASICDSSKSVTIVGGGFLGSELAYSIRRKNENVVVNQVIAESGNLGGVLPEYLSKKATESLRETGVNVMTSAKITSARKKGNGIELEVNGSKKITSDYVVMAIGVDPEISVAKASGLETDDRLGGIMTDAELRVRSGIWAAGDAASFYDRSLGRRRIEHWENAQISGRLAGENMTGAGKAFWYQPSYFTKIAPKWHINAVGVTDSSLPTVSVFAKDSNDKENYDRGVVFYKGDNGKVVGVLLLNVFGSGVDVARRLIEEARSVEDFQQLAKLFSLYKPAQPDDEEK
ncbi:pyridine nucleotide-disulfide oxidoreductase [Ancylostoma ceylanicum]|nr:pyridine nucleotide-disulfide oxidoreductase [Ancylostoma ceylanicum]EYC15977.1 hypothetical protein Y032_0035g3074 [Ancylostoma ceylanicum]